MLNMKQKNALTMYLHLFDAKKKDLNVKKKDVIDKLQQLDTLYQALAAGLDSQSRGQLHTTNEEDKCIGSLSRNKSGSTDRGNSQNILKTLAYTYSHQQRRLKSAIVFVDTKIQELLRIKRGFQNEYPLVVRELVAKNLDVEDSMMDSSLDLLYKKKDEAVRNMKACMKALNLSVEQKMNQDWDQELDEFLKKLRTLESTASKKGHQGNKTTNSPAAGPSRRSSSASKERMLVKAQKLRAATRAARPRSSSVPSSLSETDFNSSREQEEQLDGKVELPSRALPNDRLCANINPHNGRISAIEPEKEEAGITIPCGSDLNKKREVVHTPERSSQSAQTAHSFSESMTLSSLMILSTASATLGDTSSAISTDHSNVHLASRHGETTDSFTRSVHDSSLSEEHSSGVELGPSRARSSSRGRSRYIQLGLPQQRPSDIYNSSSEYDQSFNSRRGGVGVTAQREHFPRPSQRCDFFTRRPGESHSCNRQIWRSVEQRSRFLREQKFSRRARSLQQPDRDRLGDFPRATERGDRQLAPPTTITRRAVRMKQRGEREPSIERSSLSWRRNIVTSSSGVSSRASSSAGSPPRGENGDDSCTGIKDTSKDFQDSWNQTHEKDFVTVRLVRLEDVQKHQGHGLLDRGKGLGDIFRYHREKTLQELSYFVQNKLKISNSRHMRLWLFEEDESGLFLPRRMLKGHIMSSMLGSLKRASVTLFVQTTDCRERLFSFDHTCKPWDLRFVFVKAPNTATGSFVVKGHHHFDITKATRAVIEILKRKFVPHCQSAVKLFMEVGGQQMMMVSHTQTSTLNADTCGEIRHGDVFLLLEDFVGHKHLTSKDSAPSSLRCEKSQRNQNEAMPLCPTVSSSSGREVSSIVSHSTDSQHNDVFLDRERIHKDHVLERQQNELNNKKMAATEPKLQIDRASTSSQNSRFVIPYDCTASTSDESLPSPFPKNPENCPQNASPGHCQQFQQWDLTRNYMKRFFSIRKVKGQVHDESKGTNTPTQNEGLSRVDKNNCPDSGQSKTPKQATIDSTECNSVVFTELDTSSEEYNAESITASGEGCHEDKSLLQDANCNGFLSSEAIISAQGSQIPGEETAACEQLGPSSIQQSDHGMTQSTRDQENSPSDVAAGRNTEMFRHERKVSSQSKVLATTSGSTDKTETEKRTKLCISPAAKNVEDEVLQGSSSNSPRSTLRSRICRRMHETKLEGHRFPDNKRQSSRGSTTKSSTKNTEIERISESSTKKVSQKYYSPFVRQKTSSAGNTNTSPRITCSSSSSSSVFFSDEGTEEETSIYYTPLRTFTFPKSIPCFQSTELPTMDNADDDGYGMVHYSHLNPDQISAITNRSSSFMAIRMPAPEQVDAAADISGSFAERSPYRQTQNAPFLCHSGSLPAADNAQDGLSDRSASFSLPSLTDFSSETSYSLQDKTRLDALRAQTDKRKVLKKRDDPEWVPLNFRNNCKPGKMQQNGYNGPHQNLQSSVKRRQHLTTSARFHHQLLPTTRSQASLVKEEDPAIMQIGKADFDGAGRSRLNVNASEFVPRDRPSRPRIAKLSRLEPVMEAQSPQEHANAKMEHWKDVASLHQEQRSSLTHRGTRDQVTDQLPHLGQYPVASIKYRPTGTGVAANNQQFRSQDEPLARPPQVVVMTLPSDSLLFPGNQNTALDWTAGMPVYNSQSAGLISQNITRPTERPDIITRNDGLPQTNIPQKQYQTDASRHVTFADQQDANDNARNRELSSLRFGGHQAEHFAHPKFSHSRYLHPVSTAPSSQNWKVDGGHLPRKKIGSGRFGDHLKEAPVYPSHSQHEQLLYPPAVFYQQAMARPARPAPSAAYSSCPPTHQGMQSYSRGFEENAPVGCPQGDSWRHPQVSYDGATRYSENDLIGHTYTAQAEKCYRNPQDWFCRTAYFPSYYDNDGAKNLEPFRYPDRNSRYAGHYTLHVHPHPPVSRTHQTDCPYPSSYEDTGCFSGQLNGQDYPTSRPAPRRPQAFDFNAQSNYGFQHEGARYPSSRCSSRQTKPTDSRESLGEIRSVESVSVGQARPENASQISDKDGNLRRMTEVTAASKNVAPDASSKQTIRTRRGYIQIGLEDSSRLPSLITATEPSSR